MNRLHVSRTISLFLLASVLLPRYSVTVSFAEEHQHGEHEPSRSVLDYLREEVVDTVSLQRPVHFTTPETIDTVVPPGTYQVVAAGDTRLKLIASKTKHTVLVDALNTNHTEDLVAPIALYIQDDEKFPHIVLLLPEGKGLEAVGSYDASRTRAVRSFQLTPIQIRTALKQKVPQAPSPPPGVPIPYPLGLERKGIKE
jgi:hypothetical protein